MTYEIYKLLHLVGMMMLFAGAGGLVLQHLQDSPSDRARKLAGLTHGIALLILLVAGFGAAAKREWSLASPWLVGKMVIWLVFGLAPMWIRKLPKQAKLLWWLLVVLGALAGYLAIYKPVG